MKTYRKFIYLAFVLSLLVIIGRSHSSQLNRFLASYIDSFGESTQSCGDTLIIDLQGDQECNEIIDAHELIGANYFYGNKIKILSDAEIVKAEKIVHFYPTIWGGMDNEVIQFIYLYNLEYKYIQSLEVLDGIITYPTSIDKSDKDVCGFFEALTKQQVLTALEKVPAEYKRKQTTGSYEYHSWDKEEKIWKKISQKYRPGKFTDIFNEPFDIDPWEIDLVVSFKGKNGLFTKTFHDEAIVGN